jgi:hypothetical protein
MSTDNKQPNHEAALPIREAVFFIEKASSPPETFPSMTRIIKRGLPAQPKL